MSGSKKFMCNQTIVIFSRDVTANVNIKCLSPLTFFSLLFFVEFELSFIFIRKLLFYLNKRDAMYMEIFPLYQIPGAG